MSDKQATAATGTTGVFLPGAEIARLLEVPPQQLARRTLPKVTGADRKRVGQVWLYRVASVVSALYSGATPTDTDSTAQLARQRKAQADLLELRLQREREGTASIADVRAIYGVVAAELRRAVDNISRMSGPEVADVWVSAMKNADTAIDTWAEKMGGSE